jgi:hypothetical protein
LLAGRPIACFIERVAARPDQGSQHVTVGEAPGAIYGLVVGVGLPITFAHLTMAEAPRRFARRGPPAGSATLPGARADAVWKRDRHRADALLLA